LKLSREAEMQAMEESFAPDLRKMSEISNRITILEDGDGSGSEIMALMSQLCVMQKKYAELFAEKSAIINNAFVHEMESLAFQRLQEYIYWNTLYHLPQDPTDLNYRLYAEYLNTLSGLKNYYPYPIVSVYTGNDCNTELRDPVVGNGKMSKWEDTHCLTYWDLDFHFVKSKFTCKEATVGAKVYGIEFGGGQKYDPSTLETIEHSVSFGGKIGKETASVGNNLAVSVGAGVVTTIKLDGNFNIKDIIVKATVGSELGIKVPKSTDPNDSGLDIRQAASIGVSTGAELSILSGFRGTVPKVSTVGNIFNR